MAKVTTHHGVIYEPCTCGRQKLDIDDLCAILEFRYKSLSFHGKVIKSNTIHIACLRPGCMGNWTTKRVFAGKLPVMSYNDWLTRQKTPVFIVPKCCTSGCENESVVKIEQKNEVTYLNSENKSYIPSTYLYFCTTHWLEYNKENSDQES